MVEALDIQVKGIVQGVGFRPFVFRLAKKYLVNGWVLNATDGVFIHAEAEAHLLDQFVNDLHMNPPAAAVVKEVDLKEVPLEDFDTFEIRFSDDHEVKKTTLVSPDLATCDDCASELFNPNDRRFRYPFINCTNCGPRFTIIGKLPYDRPGTSMKDFPMCPRCAAEYADPLDRRFHAQPDACFECGPAVSFAWREGGEAAAHPALAPLAAAAGQGVAAAGAGAGAPEGWNFVQGASREQSDAIFAAACGLLLSGGIVAVKGLGGFHLVCDAANPQALARLRSRKRREGKAFAVMVRTPDDARRVCHVGQVEEGVLASSQRPIVLLRKRADASLAPGLADALPELGVMLPYTPVQHLLLHDFEEALRAQAGDGALAMLVMTSGNLHDEPIVTDDAEAYAKLGGIADAVLGNNRAILSRYDDSVVRVIQAGSEEAVQVIRRARGFAPLPVPLAWQPPAQPGDAAASALLAVGSEQKNTFALVRPGTGDEPAEAFVSQHIGDVENAETYDAWLAAKGRYEQLFQARPASLACDLHPEYLTSKWARDEAKRSGLPLVQVQHHHAHIASVIGEHGLDGAVCGIAFDGTGFGTDGAIWGGEVLLANRQAFERFANFAYVPMPGGAAAVRNPLRQAYGVLWAFDLLDHPGAAPALAALGDQAAVCGQMIEQGINTPYTSSVGRLFDAAAALLGVCTAPTYEGEPAILLEAAMGLAPAPAPTGTGADAAQPYTIDVVKNTATPGSTAQDTSVVLFDAAPAFRALLDDAAAGTPVPEIARRFHDAFVDAVVTAAQLVDGVYGIRTVALSGGVFMNRYLTEHALARLQAAGFTAAINRDLPPNDGCIAYGQAVVACAANDADETA